MKTKLWKAACIASPGWIIFLAECKYGLEAAFWCLGCWFWGNLARRAFSAPPIKHEIRIIQED